MMCRIIKNTNFILLFLIITLANVGCHYRKDKLVVHNNTECKIRYETLILHKTDNTYLTASSGGIVDSKEKCSPNVRNSISNELKSMSLDKKLYIIYFEPELQEYVNQHIKDILRDSLVKTKIFSLKDLDSLKWEINLP